MKSPSPSNTPGAPGARRDAAIIVVLLAGATALNALFEPHATLASHAMIYVLAIVLCAYSVSRTAAVLAAVGAVICLNFFFIDPRFSLQVEAREHVAVLAALLVVALVVSHLAAVSREQTLAAQLHAGRSEELQLLASALADAAGAGDIRQLTSNSLQRSFGECAVALADAEGRLQLQDTATALHEGLVASLREGASLGPGTGRWPGLGAWYLPLKSEKLVGGAACVCRADGADLAGLVHAQAICAMAGQALWRLRLAASAHKAEEQSRWHQAQNTFLAAISHDFRTPLAAIMTAASSLQLQRDKLPAAEQARLLALVIEEARHLTSMTDNTLQLARLARAGDLALEWESVEEIVGAVLARVRGRDAGRRIQSNVAAGLPLVRGDSVLLAQLVENLLDNALQHTSGAIELGAEAGDGHIVLTVEDRGDGIAPDEAQAIFEPFRRGDRAGSRGAGLGLAVCRAIARAHGGELLQSPRAGGGSRFELRLPLAARQPVTDFA